MRSFMFLLFFLKLVHSITLTTGHSDDFNLDYVKIDYSDESFYAYESDHYFRVFRAMDSGDFRGIPAYDINVNLSLFIDNFYPVSSNPDEEFIVKSEPYDYDIYGSPGMTLHLLLNGGYIEPTDSDFVFHPICENITSKPKYDCIKNPKIIVKDYSTKTEVTPRYLGNIFSTYTDLLYIGSWSEWTDGLNPFNSGDFDELIRSGIGILFSHSTISNKYGKDKIFNMFAGLLDIKFSNDIDKKSNYTSEKAVIKKEGVITKFPFYLGKVGDKLDIRETYVPGIWANGDVWVDQVDGTQDSGDDPLEEISNSDEGDPLFYLTTKDSVGFINIGNDRGLATDDERKLLINTIYHLIQRTNNSYVYDYDAIDRKPPLIPEVSVNFDGTTGKHTVSLKGVDEGTKYEYKVLNMSRNTVNSINYSCNTPIEVISGMSHFLYSFDENFNAQLSDLKKRIDISTPAPSNGKKLKAAEGKATFEFMNEPGKTKYLHVVAVDNMGLMSESNIRTVKVEMKAAGDMGGSDNSQSGNAGNKNKSNIGAIIGGIIGAVAAVAAGVGIYALASACHPPIVVVPFVGGEEEEEEQNEIDAKVDDQNPAATADHEAGLLADNQLEAADTDPYQNSV